MKTFFKKIKKISGRMFPLGDVLWLIFVIFIAGCATAPTRHMVALQGPSYEINSISYATLPSVINAYGIKAQWDSIGKKLKLYSRDKEIMLAVGSDIALVDGNMQKLPGPVAIKSGLIVIPRDFASSDMAMLFMDKATLPVVPKPAYPPRFGINNIIIDAGHGGKDPGAISRSGIMEKDVTLDIAKRLRHYLEESGVNIEMTRDSDRFVSLWSRADVANNHQADLFISIHANASRSRSVNGFEVYYLSEAIDDNARAIAAAENASLKFEDSSFGNKKPSNSLEATLWDIEYTENRSESIGLAKSIGDKADSMLGMNNRGVKAARFYVLKGVKVPSVLVEVGFLSNTGEARKLDTAEYRNLVAKAIAKGILDYKGEYENTEGFTR